MTAQDTEPIYFHPSKFWGATRDISREEQDRFMEEVIRLAENRELNALRRYNFITIGRVPGNRD